MLQEDELQLYESVFRLVDRIVSTPDLVVYLWLSPERVLGNIAERDRSSKRNMDWDDIAELHDTYDRYFRQYSRSPRFVLNVAEPHFVQEQQALQALVEHTVAPTEERTRRVHQDV